MNAAAGGAACLGSYAWTPSGGARRSVEMIHVHAAVGGNSSSAA